MKRIELAAVTLLLASCSTTSTLDPATERLEPPALAQSVQAEGAAAPATAEAAEQFGGFNNRLALLLGQRNLSDTDYWTPAEDQFALGFEYAREVPGSALGWELGIGGSLKTVEVLGVDVDASTSEFYGGARKTFGDPAGRWHPYIAGGLSFIDGEVSSGGVSISDNSPAVYAHAGLLFDITHAFYLGVDLRGLFGSSLDIVGIEGDVDYVQLAFALGWAF